MYKDIKKLKKVTNESLGAVHTHTHTGDLLNKRKIELCKSNLDIVKDESQIEQKSYWKSAGITLIALVITIIVLLILAGVSIAMLTGNNGILTQAKLAKENTANAKVEEERILAKNNEYINAQLGNIVPGEYIKETKKDNYMDRNGEYATIPAGFTISAIPDEQTISDGLVIYDIPENEVKGVDWTSKNDDGAYDVQTKYNQFVWIPVKSEEEYQRNNEFIAYNIINGKWEPYDTKLTKADVSYLPSSIQPDNDDPENNETAERKAVLKYNGFYIARYEAGNENSNVVSKQNATVYINKKQTEFKNLGKNMYSDKESIKSAMCSGIQWDVLMKFIDGKKDANGLTLDVKKIHEGSFPGWFINKSGKNLYDKVQNMYDVISNGYEDTAEKNETKKSTPFIVRGACNYGGNSTYGQFAYASDRNCTSGTSSEIGTFRPVLYIM